MSTPAEMMAQQRALVQEVNGLLVQVMDLKVRLALAADKAEALRTMATGVTLVSSAEVLKVLDDKRYLT